ncbi:hypothetical protein FQA47_020642 [Oryzias melastigma]|uniref:Uncharacterized protein n=1 Tax=Oryzias melastigma TaxID=30732 RepID=A0A834F758_ORYME|nr:hypothetical protein FQA47_020642 [Oryzias melastigma]
MLKKKRILLIVSVTLVLLKFFRIKGQKPNRLIVVPVQRKLEHPSALSFCAAEVPSFLPLSKPSHYRISVDGFTNPSRISVSMAASPDPCGGGSAGKSHSIFFLSSFPSSLSTRI